MCVCARVCDIGNALVKLLCHFLFRSLLISRHPSCFALVLLCLCGVVGDGLDFGWRWLRFCLLALRLCFYRALPAENWEKSAETMSGGTHPSASSSGEAPVKAVTSSLGCLSQLPGSSKNH